MSEKRTKFDKSLRSPELLNKRRSVEPGVIEWPRERVAPWAIEEKIRQRAYELYDVRGTKGGQELTDWLQAEAEIRAAVLPGKVIPFRPVSQIVSEASLSQNALAPREGFSIPAMVQSRARITDFWTPRSDDSNGTGAPPRLTRPDRKRVHRLEAVFQGLDSECQNQPCACPTQTSRNAS